MDALSGGGAAEKRRSSQLRRGGSTGINFLQALLPFLALILNF